MNRTCARAAATAASFLALAGLAACGDRHAGTAVPKAQQAAYVGVETTQAEQVAHLQSLGAKGGTSVLDPNVLLSERVKAALVAHPDFGSGSSVEVRSRDGEVTLRGRAPDPAARDRAAEIARSIPSVRAVDNQLTLG